MPSPTPYPEQAGPLTQRGQTLLDLGRPQEAVVALLQALALAPGDARLLALLSLAHGSAGDHPEALRWADRAVAAAPDGEWGHRLRAVHLLNLSAPKDALRAAEEAVRLAPQVPETLQTLVAVLLRLNRVRDAEEAAERMRRLAPEACASHETLSSVAIRGRKWREAEAHARRALALRPDSYPALNNLGLALASTPRPRGLSRKGQLLNAIDCLHRAVQSKPTDPLARTNLVRTVDRYLLSVHVAVLFFLALGLLSHVPVAMMPLCWLGAGIAYGVLFIARHRRLRALPPAIQNLWRQTRSPPRRTLRQWWETRLIRQMWVRRRAGRR